MIVRVPVLAGVPGYRPVHAVMVFDPAEPFTVTLHLGYAGGDDVIWMCDRTLLVDGLRQPTGAGDVQVWPAVDTDDVVVDLNSPDGSITLLLPTERVLTFVHAAEAMSPISRATVDVDALIAACLGGT